LQFTSFIARTFPSISFIQGAINGTLKTNKKQIDSLFVFSPPLLELKYFWGCSKRGSSKKTMGFFKIIKGFCHQ
jgi:hypothetical protein